MKLIRKHNELNLLKESDDFDWIKGIDISDYLEPPYFKNMVDIYGLKPNEYEITLSKIFNQPVTIDDGSVYNKHGNIIYYETSYGDWYKKEYDGQGNQTYYENTYGLWIKSEYDDQNKRIYYEDSSGIIIDNRNLNESDDFDWIKGIDISDYLEPPYFKNMVDMYGLSPDDYEITLSKVFNQPITIKDKVIYNNENKVIYIENNRGDWEKYEYDADGNEIHYEDVNGHWYKKEYDGQGNQTYYENAYGFWVKSEYDDQGNLIYKENSNGYIMDNRNINESDDMDWIKGVDITNYIEPPYFKNMKEYGLSEKEYEMVLSKVFNEPVTIKGDYVYDTKGNVIYFENSNGSWGKWEYDANGNEIYGENSYGYWYKYEYDNQGNKIYFEDSDGEIEDNRNLNESDDFDWIRDVEPNISFYNVRVDEKYNVELTDEFYNALNQCFDGLEPYELMGYKRTTNVRVISKRMMKHTDVYCYSENNNEVISLHLEFYNDNGTNIADHFWVTEEMVNLSPRVTDLNESDDMDWIKDVNISDYLEPPYFKSMKEYGLSEKEYEPTLSRVFSQPVTIDDGSVYNKHGNIIYYENSDNQGNRIYYEKSYGYWYKIEYDNQGNKIYYEDSDGYWWKYEYDNQGNKIYFEDSDGYWKRYEYDNQGNRIYFEDSDGEIEDNRNINESDDMDWIKGVDIVNHIEMPYFKNMKEYGLSEKEYELVLSKVFNQPVNIQGVYNDNYVYDNQYHKLYQESSNGFWVRYEYDKQGYITYHGDSTGYWVKYGYDYHGNEIYYEDSDGYIEDNRNINESDELDWIRGVDINPPYFKNTKEYGLSPDDYESTLSKIFNQPVTIRGNYVYNNRGDIIYYENNNGFWYKKEYDDQGNQIYFEDADGDWYKKEYDDQGNKLYYENSDGYWGKSEYDNQGNKIYFENSYGYIRDNRHLNESEEDGFEWIRDVDITNHIEPPYFENMKEMYGLRPEEYELVLSKVFNQPVTIKGDSIYDTKGNVIYFENSNGSWGKWGYDNQGNQTYYENSNGYIEDNR
jgi:hypothetical protein